MEDPINVAIDAHAVTDLDKSDVESFILLYCIESAGESATDVNLKKYF
jgi:hypothetical protein